MHTSLEINLLSSVSWEIEDADATVFCDACMEGLLFTTLIAPLATMLLFLTMSHATSFFTLKP